MDLTRYLFLASLQGMTEFLPVSSSGHLVFFQIVLGFEEPMLCFDVFLHLATVLSVIVFLRRDLISIFGEILIALGMIRKGKSLKRIWRDLLYLRLFVFVFIALIPAIYFLR